MAKAKYQTLEEAKEAQATGKETVRDAKQALTSYLKENKLKRNIDYADDKKHGKKITRMQNAIEKSSKALEGINEAVKDLKPAKERVSKYDYPEGITSEEKKKFRQAARAEANKGSKPKKEKKAKAEKVEKATPKAKGKAKAGGKKKRVKEND